jgi:hypothetical protein
MLAGDDDWPAAVGAMHAHAVDDEKSAGGGGAARADAQRSTRFPLAGSRPRRRSRPAGVLNYPDVLNGADVPAALRRRPMATGLNYSLIMAPLDAGRPGASPRSR